MDQSKPGDRRFANPMWDTNPYFHFIKQQYLTNAEAIQSAVAEIDNLEDIDKRRVRYFADQIVQMMAPTNFLATNPDALEKAVETEGKSLIQGLENLVADLEANDGELVVRLADETAFEIGRIGIAKIIARFWLRSLLACHYETLTAAKLAVDDAFAGPELFARTADVAARRAEIAALTQTERWQPVDSLSPPKETAHASLPWRLLMKLTFNGHLLPAFSWLGKSITLPAEQRGARRPLWGARQITYISPETSRAYTVRHNKAKALALSLPFFAAMVVALTRYQAIKERWRTGYPAYTQRSFWQNRLAVETQKRDAHD